MKVRELVKEQAKEQRRLDACEVAVVAGATGSFTPQIDGVFVKEKSEALYNGHVLFSKQDGTG